MPKMVVITEDLTPVAGRPDYWTLMTRINKGRFPEAQKIAGRWFVPVRLVQESSNDDQE